MTTNRRWTNLPVYVGFLSLLLLQSKQTHRFCHGFSTLNGVTTSTRRTATHHLLINKQTKEGSSGSSSLLLSLLKPEVTDGGSAPTKESQSNDDDKLFDWNAQWYPIIPISYLGDEPVAITVMNKDLVVWKQQDGNDDDESIASVLLDSCPHRLAPLSTGSIVSAANGDNEKGGRSCSLKCRYHGWEFDQDGSCSKMPMLSEEQQARNGPTAKKNELFGVEKFPTRTVNGLVWAFLDSSIQENDDDLPDIPQDCIPAKSEVENSNWVFNRNAVSFRNMIENTFDPAHAPFTHEGEGGGFGGMAAFSPDDTVAMAKYDVLSYGSDGFELSHTPYQLSTAQKFGFDNKTNRKYIPPCTTETSSPFFKIKIWFVPSTPTTTNVIAFTRTSPPNRIMKIAQLCGSKRLVQSLRDFAFAMFYIKDSNYRFLKQDRTTMQGQDKRKWQGDGGSKKKNSLLDLAPTVSDNGVKTFQKWIQSYGRGGPFPFNPNDDVGPFDTELSVWESHGKYNPQMQRTLQSLIKFNRVCEKMMKVSIASSILLKLISHLLTRNRGRIQLVSTLFAAAGAGTLWATDWSRKTVRRFFADGNDTWQKTLPTYYNKMKSGDQ